MAHGFVPGTPLRPETAFHRRLLQLAALLYGKARTATHDVWRVLSAGFGYNTAVRSRECQCTGPPHRPHTCATIFAM